MKNVIAFLFIWLIVSVLYTRFKYADNDERVAVFKVLAVGGLTALVTVGILTAFVIFF